MLQVLSHVSECMKAKAFFKSTNIFNLHKKKSYDYTAL